MTIKGGCLCGAVKYEISGEFQVVGNCHTPRSALNRFTLYDDRGVAIDDTDRSASATINFVTGALRTSVLDQGGVAFVSGVGAVLVNGHEIEPVACVVGLEGVLDYGKTTSLRGGVNYFQSRDYQATRLYLRYEKLF